MAARFATTQWSVVLTARDGSAPEARAALAELCEAYWYPIYAFVQTSGFDPEDAKDVTQAFFARLLETDFLDNVRPEAGRFRSFLLASVKHFMANEWDRRKAQKRGGHLRRMSLDESPTGRPSDHLSPEDLFERKWAQALRERALGALQAEWADHGKSEQFSLYQGFLTGVEPRYSYRELAARLRLSSGAVRVTVHRLRQRYAKLLREEIARTVRDASDIDAELRYVLGVLAA